MRNRGFAVEYRAVLHLAAQFDIGNGGRQDAPPNIQDAAGFPHCRLEITAVDRAHRRDQQIPERMISQALAVALTRLDRLGDFFRQDAVPKAILEQFGHLPPRSRTGRQGSCEYRRAAEFPAAS